jgi:hypothetical protein
MLPSGAGQRLHVLESGLGGRCALRNQFLLPFDSLLKIEVKRACQLLAVGK